MDLREESVELKNEKKELNGERVQSRQERPKKVEKYTRFKRGKATEIKRTCYPIGLAS